MTTPPYYYYLLGDRKTLFMMTFSKFLTILTCVALGMFSSLLAQINPDPCKWITGPDAKIVNWIGTITLSTDQRRDILRRYANDFGDGSISPARVVALTLAIDGLADLINPTPPSSFPTLGQWIGFVLSSEYRGYMHFGVEICVNNSGVITDFKVYRKIGNQKVVGGMLSHGWTPILRPLFDPGQGENGPPIAEGFPSNEITVRWHHKFRVGQLGQIFARVLTGVGVPYAWHEIRYKIRSDKTYHIEFYNSAFPSARFYIDDVMVDEHIQTGLYDFMFAGAGVEAPGQLYKIVDGVAP